MKLILKEKILSVLDSFNVYDEKDNVCFKGKGKIALTHKQVIYDAKGNELGVVKEKIIDILPNFLLTILLIKKCNKMQILNFALNHALCVVNFFI